MVHPSPSQPERPRPPRPRPRARPQAIETVYDDPARTSRSRLLGRLSLDRLKGEVIAAYGGSCAECGESRPECLQIDHVDSDGVYQARRGVPRAGTRLYALLRREGWPRDKYQLLCANCNLVKALHFRRNHVRDAAELPEDPLDPDPEDPAGGDASRR